MEKDTLIILGTIPWILFLAVIINALTGKGSPQKRLYKLFLFSLIFAVIRYGIGYDYYSYKSVIEGHWYEYELERWEILPRLIAVISRYSHYQIFFAACSILTICPVYTVCKRLSINPVYSFALYLLLPNFYIDGLSTVRNSVAYSFVLLLFYCLTKRKYIESILCIFIAYGFHVSAFVGLFMYPLFYFFHSKKLNVIAYISSLVVSAALLPFLEHYFSEYSLVAKMLVNINIGLEGGNIFKYLFNAVAVFNLINWKKISSFSHANAVYLTLVNFGICLWNVFLTIDVGTAQRLSVFYLLPIILLLPSYRFIFSKAISRGILFIFFVFFISHIIINLQIHYNQNRDMSIIPYQVFFLFPSDIFQHLNYE